MYFIDSRPEGRMLLQFQPALLACAVALTACSPEANQDQRDVTQSIASQIAITAPWSRETAAGQDAGSAFMAITNSGAAPDRLTGGSTPVATEVQIHTVDMTDGVMRMRQLKDGLEVPSGGSVTLKPGSFHIMLTGLKQPLKRGEKVPVTLTFEKAGQHKVELAVQPIGATEPATGTTERRDG